RSVCDRVALRHAFRGQIRDLAIEMPMDDPFKRAQTKTIVPSKYGQPPYKLARHKSRGLSRSGTKCRKRRGAYSSQRSDCCGWAADCVLSALAPAETSEIGMTDAGQILVLF